MDRDDNDILIGAMVLVCTLLLCLFVVLAVNAPAATQTHTVSETTKPDAQPVLRIPPKPPMMRWK